MEYSIAGVDREAVERRLGLDVSVYAQYGRWLGRILLQGSLGESLMGHGVVEERIIERLPVTIELGVLAIAIGLLIALPVGVYSAIRQDTAADYVGRSVAIIGLSTPNFWLAIMVMIYPAIWWGWSPPLELVSFSEDPLGNLAVFFIPSLTIVVYSLNMFGDAMRDLLDPRMRGSQGSYGARKRKRGFLARLINPFS